ncbi:hypothetical protein [Dickeya oryzae]
MGYSLLLEGRYLPITNTDASPIKSSVINVPANTISPFQAKKSRDRQNSHGNGECHPLPAFVPAYLTVEAFFCDSMAMRLLPLAFCHDPFSAVGHDIIVLFQHVWRGKRSAKKMWMKRWLESVAWQASAQGIPGFQSA